MKTSSPAIVLVALLPLAGCGGGADEKPTAKVTGSVTYNGKAVTGGQVIFTPKSNESGLPGKGGVGIVQPDGTFSVGTYDESDGAVIGVHTLSYEPPAGETAQGPAAGHEAPSGPTKPSPFAGLVPKTKDVTVVASPNTIDVELVKP